MEAVQKHESHCAFAGSQEGLGTIMTDEQAKAVIGEGFAIIAQNDPGAIPRAKWNEISDEGNLETMIVFALSYQERVSQDLNNRFARCYNSRKALLNIHLHVFPGEETFADRKEEEE